jgi:protein O-GlcNAc transferase
MSAERRISQSIAISTLPLDPFPHGGGMTTLEALWMGVPVVTAPGRIISSRLAAATLTAAGLTDFIATDHQHYVQLAVSKAGELDSLADLRSTLRHRLANTEFTDPIRYARAVERHYRSMWQKWCGQLAA